MVRAVAIPLLSEGSGKHVVDFGDSTCKRAGIRYGKAHVGIGIFPGTLFTWLARNFSWRNGASRSNVSKTRSGVGAAAESFLPPGLSFAKSHGKRTACLRDRFSRCEIGA